MLSTRLRLLVFLGIAAVCFAVMGSGVIDGQALPIPEEELPDLVKNNEDYTPPDWDGVGPHPGQADFESTCGACHSMGTDTITGPGFAGLYERIEAGADYNGLDPYQRVLEYVKTLDPLDPESTKDPYFKRVQEEVAGPGAQMTIRGNMPPDTTDRQYLNIIDYIFRFLKPDFDELEYVRTVSLGRDLVSGQRGFKWGGPSCIGCHSVGPDDDLMGSRIGPNIGHTYVLARRIGSDDERNYADGLEHLLGSEDAPAMHYWYRDIEDSHPLTPEEAEAVVTYFEHVARETGTERNSNYLPVLALLFAALTILLLEPGAVNILFAKEDHEYVDGPYEPDEHHDDEHAEEHKEEVSQEKPDDGEESEGDSADEPVEESDGDSDANDSEDDSDEAENDDESDDEEDSEEDEDKKDKG